ncbi:MAG TPA: nuclear transport factor 2 family protein [Longimicrobiales bacterium]|nr:nuclear transport factor 2 family protein [Longimicrobiales bacterium]
MTTAFLLVATLLQISAPDFDSLYRRYQKAVREMNVNEYMNMFTRDFSMTSPDGKVHDRAEMKKYQEINARTTKKVNAYTVTIEAVNRGAKNEYAVIVVQKYDRDQAPLEEPDKPHNIRTSVVQRETWRWENGSWKIRRIEELLVGSTYFDGKVME